MKTTVTREKNAANNSTVAIILLLLKSELALRRDPSSLSPSLSVFSLLCKNTFQEPNDRGGITLGTKGT